MQYTACLAYALAAVGMVHAAPAEGAQLEARNVNNMMVHGCTWTIEGFQRECYKGDTKCWISFGINANDGSESTKCSYESNGSKASYNSVACGAYAIGSTWSGQFGPGEGFTTLSVVKDGQIIYPAYEDTQSVDWVAVKPDQSYTPQNLP